MQLAALITSLRDCDVALFYLIELDQSVLEVFEVSLQGLPHLLPVLKGAALDVTAVLQLMHLGFDPRLCLYITTTADTQTKHETTINQYNKTKSVMRLIKGQLRPKSLLGCVSCLF